MRDEAPRLPLVPATEAGGVTVAPDAPPRIPAPLYPPGNRRWNFIAALIDAAGWGLGLGIVSHDTFLPMFVTDLHGSHYAVGLIKTLLAFGWYVPGIVVAGMIERRSRVKAFVMVFAVMERSFLLALAPLCL